MKEYTIIGDFNHKGQKYALLLDNDQKYFFLKIKENNEYDYITIQELVELMNIFSYKDFVLLIEQRKQGRKIRIIPKIIIGTLLVTLTISLGSFLNHMHSSRFDLSTPAQTTYTTTLSTTEENEIEDKTQQVINELLEDVREETENFELEDIVEGRRLQIILDSSKLDDAFGYPREAVTYDMIRETIQNNNNIPQKFKEMYIQLANNLEAQYPGLDLRVWYENLKTMKILEVDEMQMKVKAISVNAFACYRKDENTIYTVRDYEYVPGTWEYQVIMHEMCHPIRSGFFQMGDQEIRVQFENRSGEGVIIEEAMNSLFSLRSYDQNERDVAYQLQSNMIEVMVDSMDNYTYQDYVEHNITYFENELNIQNGNDKAVEMMALINLQYKDYHNDDISVEQSVFYPLYDYISTMYYAKNLNPNMSYEEAIQVRDTLIDRITYDVPEEYNIDTNHFNEFFETYCNQIGIQHGISK